MAHLASLGLSQTVKLYRSAVRHLQIMSNLPDPSVALYPRLIYALRGLHRRVGEKGQLTRLPIMPEMLAKIHRFWSQSPSTFEHVLLLAAFCLGFFGFMRSGKFTCSSMKEFASDMLTPQDVAVDSHTTPSHIVIHLKRSKNDPFGVGAWLHLGATVSSDSTSGLFSSPATITGSAVSVPGWYNPIETEVNRFPTLILD